MTIDYYTALIGKCETQFKKKLTAAEKSFEVSKIKIPKALLLKINLYNISGKTFV